MRPHAQNLIAMTTIPSVSFAVRFNMLLKSIIRQRKKLIYDAKSRVSPDLIQPKIDRLSRYVNYGFTDKGAAEFLIENQNDLKFLIPNNRSGLSTTFHVDVLIEAAECLTIKSYSHANC